MENSIYRNFTDAIRAFTAISDKDMNEIIACCSISKLKRNAYFLKEGQICSKIGFLHAGMIRHYYTTNNNEVTRWVSLENDFTSSLRSFIPQIPSIESLQAINDCALVVFDRKAFDHLITTNQGFKNLWIKTLEYNYLTIEDRVFSLIEKSAEERFDWMAKNQPRFIQQVPVMYTASMLGITPRHLSRLRKKFSI